MAKNTAAFGIFKSRMEVESAISLLETSGYRTTDISVLYPQNEGNKDFVHEKNTKAPEGGAAGAGIGAVAGGVIGLLAGLGAIAIPGLGPFIAAGPIMGLLAGAGAGGVVGGITGTLVGLGIPEYEAKRYEGLIKEGGILMSIHCDDSEWTTRAKALLKRSGATDIASTGESAADFAVSDKPFSVPQV